MHAIAFDLREDDLKKHYGEPYNKAYDEVRQEMANLGFEWIQGSVYINLNANNSLTAVYKAINRLSQILGCKNGMEITSCLFQVLMLSLP